MLSPLTDVCPTIAHRCMHEKSPWCYHVSANHGQPLWGVLVGGYVHQLWMDEQLDVIYINEQLKHDEWHTFPVGKTRFNDEALRQAGELTIHEMRKKRAGYHLIENNCQNFASNLLHKIQIGHHREFATALAVYNNAFSTSQLKGMFEHHPDDDPKQRPDGPEEGTVGLAEKVMDEQTNKIEKDEER
ncbi:PPPDE putative peptidase domain-containing protein [Microdochium nivale]|nr:PPPDE putative peptidase domain-containing protein [Microdochium nivale]